MLKSRLIKGALKAGKQSVEVLCLAARYHPHGTGVLIYRGGRSREEHPEQLPELNSVHHSREKRAAHGGCFLYISGALPLCQSYSKDFISRTSFSETILYNKGGPMNSIPNFLFQMMKRAQRGLRTC